MKAQQIIYTWDYHHGQATRVIMGGLPPLRGATMKEKQDDFRNRCDHVRTSLMQEPRGHKNMLGAVLTEPATPDGDIGMLFLSPQGYFEMCGDSTFSGVAAVIDSGILPYEDPNGQVLVKMDTVAGRVNVHVKLRDGEPMAITFDNVPSYALGAQTVQVPGLGSTQAWLGYGGLLYAFVAAREIGIASLLDIEREEMLDIGTRIWQATREQIRVSFPGGSNAMAEPKPVDLITLWEPLAGERGARVANFYAPYTTGRTPSGTGLAARVAIEAATGRLTKGETYIHESLLGLKFAAQVVKDGIPRADGGPPGVIPSITARSFLMGTSHWVLHPDDPFRHGFVF